MKKGLFFVLAALFSNQLIADEISGGSRINIQSGLLTIPCVEVDDPGSAFDQLFFDVRLKQSGDSFELIYVQEEGSEACKPLIEASLNADKDTSDVNGNLGGTASSVVEYKIGDAGPAGGIVFYITDGGLHGLEAAPVDQVDNVQWCSTYSDIPDVGKTDDIDPDSYSGAHNTPLIEAVCGSASAAGIAANYVWPYGQTDGFLPNKEELDLMYNNIGLGGGNLVSFAKDFYWSSSEFGSKFAWYQNFVNGHQTLSTKDSTFRMRAVRAF